MTAAAGLRYVHSLVIAAALLQRDREDGVGAGRLGVHGGGAHRAGSVPQLQACDHLLGGQDLPLSQTHDLGGEERSGAIT